MKIIIFLLFTSVAFAQDSKLIEENKHLKEENKMLREEIKKVTVATSIPSRFGQDDAGIEKRPGLPGRVK